MGGVVHLVKNEKSAGQSPLTESTFYILIALVEPLHGYGIMQYVDRISQGEFKLGPATLYTVLSKLVEQGLIRREEDGATADERRKMYALTGKGRQVLEAEVARRQRMACIGMEALKRMGGARNAEFLQD
jgi:DNA-binding PadR family transcriptional regulator